MVIDPIKNISLAQVNESVRTTPGRSAVPSNMFDDILSRAVNSLEDISQTEFTANRLINDFIAGKAELSDVMVATSKMNIAVQLAVTVITSAVSSFKEITGMQI